MIYPYHFHSHFDWSTFWTASGVIVALLLGIVGIFQDWVRSLFKKPSLNISIKVAPPDCHKTSFYRSDIDRKVSDTYYFRFRVENSGSSVAEEVEAMVTELYRKENNNYAKIESFLPLNLVWSHYRQITMPKIQPRLFKHLDFGFILQTNAEYLARFNIQSSKKVFFELDVAVRPNTGSHILLPGEYKIKIIFAGNNLEPMEKLYHLIIADDWSDDEKKMLEGNVLIQEL